MVEKKDTSKQIERPFLRKEIGLLKKREEEVPELKEFVLLLMKNNGHTDFIEGIKAGEFYLKSADGKQEKSILLTPNKLTTLNYNKQYFKGWIAHEDNMSPYPQDPLHNGEMFRKTTQKIAMNYKDANEAKLMEADTKRKMMMFIGIIVVIYVLYIIGKKAGWFESVDTQAVTNVAINTTKQVIKNSTGVVVN